MSIPYLLIAYSLAASSPSGPASRHVEAVSTEVVAAPQFPAPSKQVATTGPAQFQRTDLPERRSYTGVATTTNGFMDALDKGSVWDVYIPKLLHYYGHLSPLLLDLYYLIASP